MNTKLLSTLLGRFTVYAEGTITRALEAGQWWDDHLKPILDEADPAGWAIDIGAHFGWFTCYLGERHQRVVAVEPYPQSFALLLENVQRRSWLEHVQCWPVAAYDAVTRLEFAPNNDQTDAGAFGFTPLFPSGPVSDVVVPALPLSQYLEPLQPHVTVIKCDAQGADLHALKGLTQTIRRCRPLIVFEWEEGMAAWQGDYWGHYEDFFQALGYTVERIVPDYWDYVARPK